MSFSFFMPVGFAGLLRQHQTGRKMAEIHQKLSIKHTAQKSIVGRGRTVFFVSDSTET